MDSIFKSFYSLRLQYLTTIFQFQDVKKTWVPLLPTTYLVVPVRIWPMGCLVSPRVRRGSYPWRHQQNTRVNPTMEIRHIGNKKVQQFAKVILHLLVYYMNRLNNPAVNNSRTETESCYLAYLSIAPNLDALRLLSTLWTFLQSFNYNNFISYLPPYFKSHQVQNW